MVPIINLNNWKYDFYLITSTIPTCQKSEFEKTVIKWKNVGEDSWWISLIYIIVTMINYSWYVGITKHTYSQILE